MDEERYEFFSEKFGKRTSEALKMFPVTAGLCVNLCAFISFELENDGVPHSVCLGSLSCNGVKVFQYTKAFPRQPSRPVDWDGHAWIEFPHRYIGEPSLLRSAQTFPDSSNIKNHLRRLNVLHRGALLLSLQNVEEIGLKYTKKQELHKSTIPSLIRGLVEINS